MNKSRRRALNALQDRISALGLSAMFDSVKEIADELETLRDEEQDALDNLPESLQDGERGQAMRECVDYCDTALEALRAFEDIENNAEEAFAAIEDAKGAA
jgi:hypothetical protein